MMREKRANVILLAAIVAVAVYYLFLHFYYYSYWGDTVYITSGKFNQIYYRSEEQKKLSKEYDPTYDDNVIPGDHPEYGTFISGERLTYNDADLAFILETFRKNEETYVAAARFEIASPRAFSYIYNIKISQGNDLEFEKLYWQVDLVNREGETLSLERKTEVPTDGILSRQSSPEIHPVKPWEYGLAKGETLVVTYVGEYRFSGSESTIFSQILAYPNVKSRYKEKLLKDIYLSTDIQFREF